MKKIKDWSSHIIRHFWYCASECKTDESTSDDEALKLMKVSFVTLCNTIYCFTMLTNQLPFNLQDMWIGLLHHVCNDHEWLGGKCTHHEGVHDENLPWFDRRDKDFVELQKVILNPELLESFKYYTRFRYKLLEL